MLYNDTSHYVDRPRRAERGCPSGGIEVARPVGELEEGKLSHL